MYLLLGHMAYTVEKPPLIFLIMVVADYEQA